MVRTTACSDALTHVLREGGMAHGGIQEQDSWVVTLRQASPYSYIEKQVGVTSKQRLQKDVSTFWSSSQRGTGTWRLCLKHKQQ